jgi:hypothetical protein
MLAVFKYFQLSVEEKKCFLEATYYCSLFKIMLLLIPLKKYANLLGKQNIYVNKEPTEQEQLTILKISRAIARSRKIIPWKSKCFTEAITAKIMLRKRNIESTLYLGVNKEDSTMLAHAWLRSGSIWVTGRKGSGRFVVVSSFT